jgi:MFS family permease
MIGARLVARVPELLRQPSFRRFWTAQSVSYLGDQVTLIALPLVAVLAVHATTAEIGYLATAAMLPMLVLGVHAGNWVDRVGRRRLVLVSADAARVFLLVSVPVAYVLGLLSMAQLYCVAALSGVAAVLFDVGAASVVPALVPGGQRMTGNSLLRGSYSFSWVAGPGLGGLLVQLLTAPFALVFDAASFLVSAALMRTVGIPEAKARDRAPGGVTGGLRFVARHPVLRAYLVSGTVLSFCYAVYFTLLIVFAVRQLRLTPAQIGLAIGAGAVGALAGSVLTARITRRLGVGAAVILGALIYAAALLAIPFASRTHPWAAFGTIAGAEFVSGFGLMLNDINGLSLQQTLTPERMLGRVSGASMASTYGARALAGVVAGTAGTVLGLAPTIALSAALGVVSISVLLASPIRSMKQLPQPPTSRDEPANGPGLVSAAVMPPSET